MAIPLGEGRGCSQSRAIQEEEQIGGKDRLGFQTRQWSHVAEMTDSQLKRVLRAQEAGYDSEYRSEYN